MSDLSLHALEIAKGEIGKQEIPRGSNWGPDVQKYLMSVKINFPASWCMAFMYWCMDNASHSLGVGNPMKRTGGVLDQWNSASDTKKVLMRPEPGDIFIMDFGKGLGHTGIVEKVEGDIIHTIEGNTNDTGSREGYEVCRRTRQQEKIKGYLRY